MKNNEKQEELAITTDYKNLYFDLKEKYNKLEIELEELRIKIKLKEEEINKLKDKIKKKENIIRLNLNSFDKNDNNDIYKNNSKKYETYSIDSFRNEQEQRNDLLNELIKTEFEEIKNNKNIMIIENYNFKIVSNKKNIKDLTNDIDIILSNIKKKQESLHQTQKMLNLKTNNENKFL